MNEKKQSTGKYIREEIVKVRDNVYKISFDYGLRPNIGLFEYTEGILLVDTGHKVMGQDLKKLIAEKWGKEVNFVINTHGHGDHVGANVIFEDTAAFIDYKKNKKWEYKGRLKKSDELLTGMNSSLLVKYTMPLDKEVIKIIPCINIHSGTDILVWFSHSGVIHMGDLLLTQSFPAVTNTVAEYIHFLETVVSVFPVKTKFIGGHGRIFLHKDVKTYLEILKKTIIIVRNEFEKGKKLRQIQKDRVLKEWEYLGEFLKFLDANSWIEAIYRSYTSIY